MEARGEHEEDEERRHLGGSGLIILRDAAGSGGGGGSGAGDSDPSSHQWPTVDGPLGLSEEESVAYARRFFLWGFAFLPLLWAVNCFYFWPVLRSRPSSPSSFSRIRPYVLRSAIGFLVFAVLLSSWALTFVIGGAQLFGPVWPDLVMYNLADKLGLTGWV